MLLEPHGKELYLELCNRLNALKLVTDDEQLQEGDRGEGVPFFFRNDVLKRVNHPNLQLQVATIEFNGGNHNLLRNEVTGVTLRFYLLPLSVLGLDQVLNKFKANRSELKESPSSPYYNYVFVDPYSSDDVYRYIDALFTKLAQHLNDTLNLYQNNLLLADFPGSQDQVEPEPEPVPVPVPV